MHPEAASWWVAFVSLVGALIDGHAPIFGDEELSVSSSRTRRLRAADLVFALAGLILAATVFCRDGGWRISRALVGSSICVTAEPSHVCATCLAQRRGCLLLGVQGRTMTPASEGMTGRSSRNHPDMSDCVQGVVCTRHAHDQRYPVKQSNGGRAPPACEEREWWSR